MLVGAWMTADPKTLPSTATLRTAAMEMRTYKIRRMPIVDGGKLVGILSKFDLARAFPPGINPFAPSFGPNAEIDRPIHLAMSRQVTVVAPPTPLEEAAQLLRHHKIGAMPVVQDGVLTGIITESDIFRAFAAALGIEQEGVRVTLRLGPNTDAVEFAHALATKSKIVCVSVVTLHEDGHRIAVLRFQGREPAGFIDSIWQSGHSVRSVHRTGPGGVRLVSAPQP